MWCLWIYPQEPGLAQTPISSFASLFIQRAIKVAAHIYAWDEEESLWRFAVSMFRDESDVLR